MTSARNKETPLQVKGIYKAPPFQPLLGGISILTSKFDMLYEQLDNLARVHQCEGRAEHEAAGGLGSNQAVASCPDAKVQTRKAWIDSQIQDFNNFLVTLHAAGAVGDRGASPATATCSCSVSSSGHASWACCAPSG